MKQIFAAFFVTLATVRVVEKIRHTETAYNPRPSRARGLLDDAFWEGLVGDRGLAAAFIKKLLQKRTKVLSILQAANLITPRLATTSNARQTRCGRRFSASPSPPLVARLHLAPTAGDRGLNAPCGDCTSRPRFSGCDPDAFRSLRNSRLRLHARASG